MYSFLVLRKYSCFFFFFNDTATTEIYTLSLHDALPIKPFEQVLYYAQLARRYMPPGLLPRATTGPRRVRRAGEDVRFPKERALPAFLLRSAELSFLPQRYAGRLTGLTSDPALYGRPTVFGATGPQLAAGAMLNHVRAIPVDTAGATLGGITLPAFDVPGVPLRLDPGAATTQL